MNEIWLNNNTFDFEYNKYQILGFVKKAKLRFSKLLLQPSMNKISAMLKAIQDYKTKNQTLENTLKTPLIDIDLKEMKFIYENIETTKQLDAFKDIIEYKASVLEQAQKDGHKMNDFISNQIDFSPFGIMPYHNDYGYLFLSNISTEEVDIFSFQNTFYATATDDFKYISTKHIDNVRLGIMNSYNNIKLNLLKKRKYFANPAAYVFESNMYIPVQATFLPIAKLMLAQHINKNNK